jgi:EF-hand domain pair
MRDQEARRKGSEQAEEIAPPQEEQSVSPTRFVGGQIPPVQLADASTHGPTASEQGYEQKDKNVEELKSKISALVSKSFGGDYKKAFDHYDTDHDGAVTKSELTSLLSDAGVGNSLTRGTWASRIIEKLDKNGDSKIEWDEFESIFSGGGGGGAVVAT